MIMLKMPLLFVGATFLAQYHMLYLTFYKCWSTNEKVIIITL